MKRNETSITSSLINEFWNRNLVNKCTYINLFLESKSELQIITKRRMSRSKEFLLSVVMYFITPSCNTTGAVPSENLGSV